MKQNLKHIQQFKEAKSGLKLFYEDTLLINDYEELQNHLNNLASYFQRVEKDQAKNKYIILFKTYLQNESENKKSLKTIRRKKLIKNTKKKLGFKDYLSGYHILKNRGMSYRGISRYSEKFYKVKVSKDTLRKYLNLDKEVSEDEK